MPQNRALLHTGEAVPDSLEGFERLLASQSEFTKLDGIRLYGRAYVLMSDGDGYQPFGYDWPTLRITKPRWYQVLRKLVSYT